jgi:hypothetical protein
MDQARFSVCRFFPDDSYEFVRRFVNIDEAVEAFSSCVGGCTRVVVTDSNNRVNLEWTFGAGIRRAGV